VGLLQLRLELRDPRIESVDFTVGVDQSRIAALAGFQQRVGRRNKLDARLFEIVDLALLQPQQILQLMKIAFGVAPGGGGVGEVALGRGIFRDAGEQSFAGVGEQPLGDLGARRHPGQNVIQCTGFNSEIPRFVEQSGALGLRRRQRRPQIFKLRAR